MKKLLTELDAIYIQSLSNLFYFSKYKSADAKILITKDSDYYFTDARYFEEVENLPFVIKNISDFYVFLKNEKIENLGTDLSISIDEYELLQKYGIKTVKNVSSYIQNKRSVKTDEEIRFIEKAQSITDKTFSDVLGSIKEGMTERELDSILKSLLYKNGAEGLAFDPIVAFGKNTSKPHAHPGDNVLSCGDFITLDFGASYNSYCSDMTRTVAFGKPTEEMVKIYNYVLESQNKAIDALHAGIIGKDAQKIVEDYFTERGVREYFTHSLGHSLGIDIHENPNLSAKNALPIPEGCVTSVEPGLYFPQKFGVRIEDIVVFLKNGVKNLTNSPKKLIII